MDSLALALVRDQSPSTYNPECEASIQGLRAARSAIRWESGRQRTPVYIYSHLLVSVFSDLDRKSVV